MVEPETSAPSKLATDPPSFVRAMLARMLNRTIDPDRIAKAREKAERKRQRIDAPHRVIYFHQVDDPYSCLAAQVLEALVSRFDIQLEIELIQATRGINQPRYDALQVWARNDAAQIAPHLRLSFPSDAPALPDPDCVTLSNRILASLSTQDFVRFAPTINDALWREDWQQLQAYASHAASAVIADQRLQQGSNRLAKLGHYSGAMFFYAGEWYWGIDRLNHLEDRLREIGAARTKTQSYTIQRPSESVEDVDGSHLQLDYYPSLNSPYTAISFDRTMRLKADCGIKFHMKPVLPMLMRGVPASMTKARYVFFDSKREADLHAIEFGPVMPPIGRPVRQAYSLLPWAQSIAKSEALMSSLLHHTFVKKTPLHKRSGLKRAITDAGLEWREAEKYIGSEEWKPIVAQNQTELVDELGLWGVPSYRLSGPGKTPTLDVWGQDRLWLLAAEIRRRSR